MWGRLRSWPRCSVNYSIIHCAAYNLRCPGARWRADGPARPGRARCAGGPHRPGRRLYPAAGSHPIRWRLRGLQPHRLPGTGGRIAVAGQPVDHSIHTAGHERGEEDGRSLYHNRIKTARAVSGGCANRHQAVEYERRRFLQRHPNRGQRGRGSRRHCPQGGAAAAGGGCQRIAKLAGNR